MFPVRRQASWWLIALVIGVEAACVAGWARLLARPSATDMLGAVLDASHGLIGPSLLFGLVPLLLVVFLTMFAVGGMPADAVGWIGRKVGPAFLVGIVLWVALQIVLVVVALLGGHGLTLTPAWSARGFGYLFGGVLGQLFGIALHDETVYRGFLFPQLAAKLARLGRARALLLGALGSQLVYALAQLANLLLFQRTGDKGVPLDLLGLLLLGLWFAACYMVTENLFVCVVIHALMNEPAALVQVSSGATQIALYALTILVLSAWGPLEVLLDLHPRPRPGKGQKLALRN